MTARQRFMIMVALDAVCVLVALGAILADVRFHQPYALPTFAVSILIGFGVQIWFIVGLAKSGRLEKGV